MACTCWIKFTAPTMMRKHRDTCIWTIDIVLFYFYFFYMAYNCNVYPALTLRYTNITIHYEHLPIYSEFSHEQWWKTHGSLKVYRRLKGLSWLTCRPVLLPGLPFHARNAGAMETQEPKVSQGCCDGVFRTLLGRTVTPRGELAYKLAIYMYICR